MPKFKTTIEVEVEVEYTVEPSQKGSCDSMGVPEEPSWDAHVDDVSFFLTDFEAVTSAAKDEAESHYTECLDENKLQRQLQKKGA
jgi:hypothetical protein